MMDALHRILSGGPKRRAELIAAGAFVAVWFAMDLVEFADWAWSKFSPQQTAICLPVSFSTLPNVPLNNMPLISR